VAGGVVALWAEWEAPHVRGCHRQFLPVSEYLHENFCVNIAEGDARKEQACCRGFILGERKEDVLECSEGRTTLNQYL